VSIQLNIFTCPTYPEKFVRDNIATLGCHCHTALSGVQRLFVSYFKGFTFAFTVNSCNAQVIVWRLRWNIIITVLCIANVLPIQWAQLTKTVHTAQLGLEFVFLCFLGCTICLYVGICFVLPWTVESFFFMLWR